jgi:hypothetical protein
MVGKWFEFGFACALATSVSGCLAPQSDALTGLISSNSAVTTTSSASGDLYVKVSTSWETTPTLIDPQFTCSIPSGSATVSTTCTGKIPEGQLHYSTLHFTVGTSNPSTCAILIFRPYYYLGSTAALFNPPWDSTITGAVCNTVTGPNGGPADANCYDGVAKQIVASFPTYTGMYFLTANGGEKTYDADSANLKHAPTNRWTCNNKVDKTAAVAGYVANTMQDYVIECRDTHNDLTKQITLTLGDEDTVTGEAPGAGVDDFNDWLAP